MLPGSQTSKSAVIVILTSGVASRGLHSYTYEAVSGRRGAMDEDHVAYGKVPSKFETGPLGSYDTYNTLRGHIRIEVAGSIGECKTRSHETPCKPLAAPATDLI